MARPTTTLSATSLLAIGMLTGPASAQGEGARSELLPQHQSRQACEDHHADAELVEFVRTPTYVSCAAATPFRFDEHVTPFRDARLAGTLVTFDSMSRFIGTFQRIERGEVQPFSDQWIRDTRFAWGVSEWSSCTRNGREVNTRHCERAFG